MKAAARLPSPFPSPPLLVSPIRPHIHTVVSPRNHRRALYVGADLLSPAVLHPLPRAVSLASTKKKEKETLSAHGDGSVSKTGAKKNWCHRGRRLGSCSKVHFPLWRPTPPDYVTHANHTSVPSRHHSQSNKRQQAFLCNFGRGKRQPYLATTHLQQQICSP